MYTLERPEDLSDNAWKMMQAVYENYEKNDSKEFEDFSQFNFSAEELDRCCKELDDKSYVFWERPSTGEMYLYMLTKILPYAKLHRSI
ncbi:hypothetical protein CACET_c32150 [Clostridium aceticum]|uniref:Uncharacterized protein n=1 Tax=Clostridium aceticum TaxID=84022 RepID=A0A0D8I6Q1_9CLOT|nr:hypothetical protein [Clostridium aceticum]AKL96659.1 hypothetical protein CACET_c32150 [Clostridium aceticum]KJF25903.1 hypothetical protein TZ02_16085 [Clostridium aceticum]